MKNWEIDTENPTCYYFNDVISINDLDLDNILKNQNIVDSLRC